MRTHARVSVLALLTGVLLAALVPAAAQAEGFGIEKFVAANCKVSTCGEGAEEPTLEDTKNEGYLQAGGFVPYGITDFVMKHHEQTSPFPAKIPNESVKTLRTDVAPGVVTNPEAITKCSQKDFESTLVNAEHGFYLESSCPESSLVGENIVETAVEVAAGIYKDFTLRGKVYNLEQPYGLASEFGVALDVEELAGSPGIYAHTYIKGSVEWLSDYHDYFTIENITPGVLSSRLIFYGATEEGEGEPTGFLRNPSKCTKGSTPETTTTVSMVAYNGETASRPYATLLGSEKCELEPFAPAFKLTPETTASDAADGVTAELTMPHSEDLTKPDSSDVQTATVSLPPGMTMNPSAGAGLEGCTPAQIGLEPVSPNVSCPGGSRIGTVELEVPTLPRGALSGPIYLGEPASGTITAPPYTVYLDAESARYGVKVRLKGTVTPNLETGQLTTTFENNPQAPFNDVILHFKGGAFAPIANPLTCGVSTASVALVGYSGASASPFSNFPIEGCNPAPAPFAPAQATSNEPGKGGAGNTFTIGYERPEGSQYLTRIGTVLPPGLVGLIPTVEQCPEPHAAQGTCGAASQIGTVTATSGSGTPYTFHGRVYLTGPTEGAPFGLSIVVSAVAGPFNLGSVIARVAISVNQTTGQVIATDNHVPTIVGGIPIRLRTLAVSINRQGFELNPTNCGVLSTQSVISGSLGTEKFVSTPFQAEGCSSLGFAPTFKASTGGKPSKTQGASLETTLNMQAGGANVKSVLVTLPKQLPSRQTTLQKACLAATFEANPYSCPEGSMVGNARANTPTLPGKLQGPAYLVSHGGAKFPDLDLVLEANGVRVILTGNTDIKNGITTTNFASTPDVPVSSITVNLPMGPHSALAAYGNLCTAKLVMPTTITAQNGKQFKQNTAIAPKGCGVQIVGQKVSGNTAYLTIKSFAAGRISGSGPGLTTVARHFNGAQNAASLKVPLSNGGRRKPYKVKIRVGFYPKTKSVGTSTAYTTVVFR